jgi:hypothetical protein
VIIAGKFRQLDSDAIAAGMAAAAECRRGWTRYRRRVNTPRRSWLNWDTPD